MAKETMIVFVYDTECLKDEADDPVNAVLYFHPSWVSDIQKVALCGQLMGTTYFLNDCFFKPRILALQNGKFVLQEFGRFILAVGTDRNISDNLLLYRADLLTSLIRLFHRDLQTISTQFALQSQYKNLGDKLYHIFETYLPILQHKGNIFQNIPKLRMPKTACNMFLSAIQILECCQKTPGILGGAILYHNKVVATQLSDVVTKQLVLTDPLHVRTSAEQITSTNFHIPNGVQMIVVYIDTHEYYTLSADAQHAQQMQKMQSDGGNFQFLYPKEKFMRDTSLIFTHIPEEGTSGSGSGADPNQQIDVEAIQPFRAKPVSMRPTYLPLRFKNMNSKEAQESVIASINFDETDSYPEYIGLTSVCSTPMTENKVLPMSHIMSICVNTDEPKLNKLQQAQQRRSSLKRDFESFFQSFMTLTNKAPERRSSLTDIQDSFKKISKKLSLKPFSVSINKKTDVNRNSGDDAAIPNDDEHELIENDGDDNSSENSSISNSKISTQTINDPTNPIFNANGQPISRGLFQELLEKYYKLFDASKQENKQEEDIAQLIAEFHEFDEELKKLDASLKQEIAPRDITAIKTIPTTNSNAQTDRNLNIENLNKKTSHDKKSLSLPIKPLAMAMPSNDAANQPTSTVFQRKQSGGVPLTPLMAKLSVLALNDEQQRNNWDVTPGGAIEIQTPLSSSKAFAMRNSIKCDDGIDALTTPDSESTTRDNVERVELYICGQQNMTLLLLMETGTSGEQKVVQKMFDMCVAKFPHMETYLNQTLNVNVEGDKRDGSYSFVSIDSKWGAMERKGPWNPVELSMLECMQQDLQRTENREIMDLVLRSNDATFYGYKFGRAEFLYKETASHPIAGIPPPSDPMGNIAMRAKTNLERDHGYVLF